MFQILNNSLRISRLEWFPDKYQEEVSIFACLINEASFRAGIKSVSCEDKITRSEFFASRTRASAHSTSIPFSCFPVIITDPFLSLTFEPDSSRWYDYFKARCVTETRESLCQKAAWVKFLAYSSGWCRFEGNPRNTRTFETIAVANPALILEFLSATRASAKLIGSM